jgi:integrase
VAEHHKSIIKEALDRLEDKMAIHESRGEAKEQARRDGAYVWAYSTGKIHSFKTRSTYQEHVLKFVSWARSQYSIKSLEQLDARADELATEWLQQQVDGKSPYTLQVERAALRLFFGKRALASTVCIPRRARSSIMRSRGEKAHDRHFQPANWQPLLKFLEATGLRRQEVRDLRCGEVSQDDHGQVYVYVRSGKGGRERRVGVLPGRETDVLSIVAGRDPKESVFGRIPKHLDVHSYRRLFAQALYLHHEPGRNLPPAAGRLKPGDYDRVAAMHVTEALGHNRIDVVLRHYLR